MIYLFCCYEFGNICHKILQEHVDYIVFLIYNQSIHHHQFKYLVHFLKYASKQVKLKELTLHLTNDNITMHDIKHIVEILPFIEELSLTRNINTLAKVWQHLANEIYRRQGTDFKINKLKISIKGSGKILSAISLFVPFMKEFQAVDDGCREFDCGFDALANQIYCSHTCSGFRLEMLDLSESNLTDQQQAVLVKCFRFIRKIILDYCTITVATCQSFTQMISEDTRDGTLRVEELSLCDCNLEENHFVALAGCLPLLKEVNLRLNRDLGLKSCEIIKNSIFGAAKDKTLVLENIDLSDCWLQEEHLVIIADCIPHLKIVNLEGSQSGSAGFKAINNKIYEAAKDGTLLTKKLSLYNYGPTTDEIVILSQCLPYVQMFSLKSLISLDLECLKELNDNICETAKDRTLVLEKLEITGCVRTCDDFSLCIDFLRYLKAVDLSGNYFTVDSCKILKDTILNSAEDGTLVLEEITLRRCRLTKDHFYILADCMANLKMVDLSVNRHSGLEGVNAVKENIKAASINAARIGQNPKLQHLDLSGSIMESEQLMVLAEVLPYIKFVKLSEHLSSPLNWHEFVEAFKELQNLSVAVNLYCKQSLSRKIICVVKAYIL